MINWFRPSTVRKYQTNQGTQKKILALLNIITPLELGFVKNKRLTSLTS
mgnify:CR=1 FL=1